MSMMLQYNVRGISIPVGTRGVVPPEALDETESVLSIARRSRSLAECRPGEFRRWHAGRCFLIIGNNASPSSTRWHRLAQRESAGSPATVPP